MTNNHRLIKSDSKKHHPELDFEALEAVYEDSPRTERLSGEQISGPFEVYSVETLRDRHGVRVEPAAACDIFVLAKGEPEDRSLTKVRGIPYWPAQNAWPHSESQKPYRFLAQFNFADSQDLVGDIPGEVLLLLTPDVEDWLQDAEDNLRYEWVSITEDDLVSHDDWNAIAGEDRTSWYGVIHRTADYPAAYEGEPSVYDRFLSMNVRQPYNLPVVDAVKIGGVPHWIQGEDSPGGRFLCQLTSVQATPEVRFPWVNVETPMSMKIRDTNSIYYDDNSLCFYDMGTLTVFLMKDGTLRTCFQFY